MIEVPGASRICYGGKGDQRYGVFNAPITGKVLRFILINVEGGFYCSLTTVSKSIWGCLSKPDVVVTDSNDDVLETSRIVLRNSTLTAEVNGRLFYVLFSPVVVQQEQEFRIWTSESLFGRTMKSSTDVTGSHCVQISMGYLASKD